MKQNKKYIYYLEAILLPAFVLILWFVLGVQGRINEALLPTLQKTFETGVDLIKSGKLGRDVVVSVTRVIKGFLIGSFLGLTIGTLMGLSKTLFRMLNSLVSIVRPIPMMALIPLFILWLGIGEACKVTLITVGCFWSVLLNTIQGMHLVDSKQLEVARVLEKDKKTIFLKIYLPTALPSIFTGLRLGMGVSWSCVVAAEMMAASSGIGYMLMFARTMSQPDRLMVGVFTIGIIGLLIDKIMLWIQKKILWWS